MSRDDDSYSKAGEPPDSVTFGSSRPHRRRWSPWLRYVVAGFVGAGLVAVVVVAVVRHGSTQAASPSPRATGAENSPASGSSTTSAVPSRPVVVTRLGHRVLGVRAGWELFARGSGGLSGPPGELVRIQLAKGAP